MNEDEPYSKRVVWSVSIVAVSLGISAFVGVVAFAIGILVVVALHTLPMLIELIDDSFKSVSPDSTGEATSGAASARSRSTASRVAPVKSEVFDCQATIDRLAAIEALYRASRAYMPLFLHGQQEFLRQLMYALYDCEEDDITPWRLAMCFAIAGDRFWRTVVLVRKSTDLLWIVQQMTPDEPFHSAFTRSIESLCPLTSIH